MFGLLAAGLIGYFLVPVYGWRAMFVVGLVPAILTIPMRWFMVESPRWLLSVGRTQQASDLVARMENGFQRRGISLETPIVSVHPLDKAKSDIRELFKGMYFRRTVLLTALWVCSYMIANGLITWLPTLYRQIFQLPLQTSLAYGFATSAFGCAAALFCALYIDKVGRKIWYTLAFFLAAVPMVFLAILGAELAQEVLIFATATYAVIQTVTFSLYLYSAELYPTSPARRRRGLWKRMAAYRVGHWTVVGRMGGGKLQHQLRVRRVRGCPRNRRDHLPFVCARDEGSRSRGTVALTLGGIKKMNAYAESSKMRVVTFEHRWFPQFWFARSRSRHRRRQPVEVTLQRPASGLAADALPQLLAWARKTSRPTPVDDITFLPVIPNPQKILCVGLNYVSHRTETKRPETEHPSIFTRFADTQVGHKAAVLRPKFSTAFDYEGELAVVIGRGGRHIAGKAPRAHRRLCLLQRRQRARLAAPYAPIHSGQELPAYRPLRPLAGDPRRDCRPQPADADDAPQWQGDAAGALRRPDLLDSGPGRVHLADSRRCRPAT